MPLFEFLSGESVIEADDAPRERWRPLLILILGPPGSGKGTQAAMLGDRLQIPHVSTGDMLRERILAGDELGRRIAGRIDFGQFVPDEWINQILDERMANADCRYGVILDGYPRTRSQSVRLLERLADTHRVLVARLLADEHLLADRFSGRRQCSVCSALFHLRYQPSLAGERCDRQGCDGVLQARADDRPDYLARRLSDFERLTAPVTAVLEAGSIGVLSLDAGLGTPDEIHERIFEGFQKLLRKGVLESTPAGERQQGSLPWPENEVPAEFENE